MKCQACKSVIIIMYLHYCNYLMNDATHAIIYFLLEEDIAVSIILITVGVFLICYMYLNYSEKASL